ncbi:MAG TPA: hypothetical protein VG013_18010 [Gemmataceae bacterium]|nr:hypothetical protein [Gemmataceae bacterium]
MSVILRGSGWSVPPRHRPGQGPAPWGEQPLVRVGEQVVVQPVEFNASHKVPVGLWAVAGFHGRSLLVKPPHWQERRRQPMA